MLQRHEYYKASLNGTSRLINGKVGPPLQTTIVNEFVYSESASNVTLITVALTLEDQALMTRAGWDQARALVSPECWG